MADLRIALTIIAETALSIGAGGSAGTIADKSIVRDGRGRPIIPGSQVKGKARHAAEAIARALGASAPLDFDADQPDNPIRALFGSPRHRSPLRFADLTADVPLHDPRSQPLSEIRPSVTINRRRGVAEDQRLVLQEAARAGLSYASTQAITGTLDDQAHAALLWAALRTTTRWGGAKSRGLGWAIVAIDLYWNGNPLDDLALGWALRALAPQQENG